MVSGSGDEGLIDIHCHILPQVDDGSADIEMTRRMLQTAWSEGIDTIIATPHYHPVRGKNDIQAWRKAYHMTQQIAGEIDPRMRILAGCELLYRQGAEDLLREGILWTMAGSRYVLTEFPSDSGGRYITDSLKSLRRNGFYPILAHAERYPDLADPERIGHLIDAGVYIQVNADTVVRSKSLLHGRFIRTLLKKRYVHFVSTDAHDDRRRPPLMRECKAYITKWCGASYARELCEANAHSIFENTEI